MNQNQNVLIGGLLVAFGFYLLGLKLHLIVPLDAMLLLAVAFLGGYLYRRSLKDPSANILLLIGNLFAGIFISDHIHDGLTMLFGANVIPHFGTGFYIGLAFLATWLIESLTEIYHRRRHNFYLFVGAILTLMGSYELMLNALNISPALVRTFLMPLILILIGGFILLGNRTKKIF